MRTDDYGATWTPVADLWTYSGSSYDPPPRADVHPAGSVAFLGYRPGDEAKFYPSVYVSLDPATRGNSSAWTPVTDAAAGTNVGSFVTGLHWDRGDATGRTLYVSVSGRSVYVARF